MKAGNRSFPFFRVSKGSIAPSAVIVNVQTEQAIRYGLLIPDDCSVCSFDNIFASRFHNINLTTIDSFLIEKEKDAFELLTRKIQNYTGTDSASVFQIEYKPQVIARKSTGPANIT